jgi:hypothetical protein
VSRSVIRSLGLGRYSVVVLVLARRDFVLGTRFDRICTGTHQMSVCVVRRIGMNHGALSKHRIASKKDIPTALLR